MARKRFPVAGSPWNRGQVSQGLRQHTSLREGSLMSLERECLERLFGAFEYWASDSRAFALAPLLRGFWHHGETS